MQCAAIEVCAAGEEATASATPTTDRNCTACGTGKFSNVNTKFVCTTTSICDVGKFVLKNATASSDRECNPCSLGYTFTDAWNMPRCKALTPCGKTAFAPYPPSVSANRICNPVTMCAEGAKFQTVAATATTDTFCQPVRVCSPGSYQSAPPTVTADRQCASVTSCVLGVTFQVEAPSASADRQCANVTTCGSGSVETGKPSLTLGAFGCSGHRRRLCSSVDERGRPSPSCE